MELGNDLPQEYIDNLVREWFIAPVSDSPSCEVRDFFQKFSSFLSSRIPYLSLVIGGSGLTESLPVEEIVEFFVTFQQSDLEQGPAHNSSVTIKQENSVQRFRRKRKEKTEANKRELASLDDAKEEMVLQLRELKGELKIMSELSGAGLSHVLQVQQYLDMATGLDR